MNKTVFWDTAAFFALFNAKDDLHHMAVNVSRDLAKTKARVLTTDVVLTELSHRLQFFYHEGHEERSNSILRALRVLRGKQKKNNSYITCKL